MHISLRVSISSLRKESARDSPRHLRNDKNDAKNRTQIIIDLRKFLWTSVDEKAAQR